MRTFTMPKDSLQYQIENYYAVQDSQTWSLIGGVFAFTGFFALTYDILFIQKDYRNIIQLCFILILLIGGIILIYNVINPKIHLIIDKSGIWINGDGKYKWQDFQYFHTEEKYRKGANTVIFYYSIKGHAVMSVDISLTTTDFQTLRYKINVFKGSHEVEDYGHTNTCL